MSATFPDISDWYTPERIAAEELLWANGPYRDNARRVMDLCRQHHLSSVVEAGCGTGWVPIALDPLINYVGVDSNPHMVRRAREKNPQRHFIERDIRRLASGFLPGKDLVCSFAVLKHFSLSEWPSILASILSVGRYTLFTQHVLLDDRPAMDVGTEFHHVWPTKAELLQTIESCGHEVLDMDYSAMDAAIGAPEAYVSTRRRA